jgi:hypothetical protein
MDMSKCLMRRQQGLVEKLSREGLEKEKGAFVAMGEGRDYGQFFASHFIISQFLFCGREITRVTSDFTWKFVENES